MLDNNSFREKIFSGLLWSYFERFTAQLVSLIVSIVLARMIEPAIFGTIAIVMALITILNTFSTVGFGNALVQKKNADQTDFSSVFWVSVALSFGFYILLWFTAPLIACYYNNKELIWIIRIMTLRLPISAINSIQHAYIQKRMEFKKFFFSTLGGTIASAFVGISMAMGGYGVWALVGQFLTNSLIDTIVVFITTKWKPSLIFSIKRTLPLLSYGWKIMLTGLIADTTNEVRALILGKKFSSEILAYYDRGQRFPQLIIGNVSVVLAKVSFPAFSNINGDNDKVKKLMQRSMQVSLFFVAPLMIGMAAIARNMIIILMTEKWLNSVQFVQILSIYYLFYPVMSTAAQAIKAQGRGNDYLFLGIIRCSLEIILIYISVFVFKSVFLVAISSVISIITSTIVCMYQNSKCINYSLKEQIVDILKPISISLIMGLIVVFVGLISIFPVIIVLTLQVVVGFLVYIIVNMIVKEKTYLYVVSIACDYRKRIKNTHK